MKKSDKTSSSTISWWVFQRQNGARNKHRSVGCSLVTLVFKGRRNYDMTANTNLTSYMVQQQQLLCVLYVGRRKLSRKTFNQELCARWRTIQT